MKEVFEAYPDVDKIFLVEGMPFFKYNEALNYAGGFTDKVQTYTRLQAEHAEAGDVSAEAEQAAKDAAEKAKAEAEQAVAAKTKK
jgi:hypothetical protein